MKLRCLAIIIFSVGGCHSNQASEVANLFGEDNRVAVTSSAYPYSALGSLAIGCSAVMVGRRMALTAAHCVVDIKSKKIHSGLTKFNLLKLMNGNQRSSWIQQIWYGTKTPEDIRSKDWAILILTDPSLRFGTRRWRF